MSVPAPVLYDEDGVRVTPSWIGVDDVSHAVKNVVRLRRVEHRRARGSWHALFWTLSGLALVSASLAVRGEVAFALAWGAFAASLALALLAAWHAFVAPDAFAVEIGLADGTRLEAPAGDRGQLERLHGALAHALDWHGGTPVGALVPGVAPMPSSPSPGTPMPSGAARTSGPFETPSRRFSSRRSSSRRSSGEDVVRVVDQDGRVVGEDPFAVDARAPHRRR